MKRARAMSVFPWLLVFRSVGRSVGLFAGLSVGLSSGAFAGEAQVQEYCTNLWAAMIGGQLTEIREALESLSQKTECREPREGRPLSLLFDELPEAVPLPARPSPVLSKAEADFLSFAEKRLSRPPFLREYLELAKERGAGFVGFEAGSSNANTDPHSKEIRVRDTARDSANDQQPRDRLERMTLSYAYELSNAINAERFQGLAARAQVCEIPPVRFVAKTLVLEAEAVLRRSLIAKAMGRTDLLKNQKYIEIADDSSRSVRDALERISAEMVRNGVVTTEKIPVAIHYCLEYFKHYPKCAAVFLP